MKLRSFRIQIKDGTSSLKFYTEIIGMKLIDTIVSDIGTLFRIGFDDQKYHLELFQAKEVIPEVYKQNLSDNYWKYSLFVADIKRVYKSIHAQEITIGEPTQFGEIGYLAHTKDPDNHEIEFIQQRFEKNTVKSEPNDNYPLKENPKLGLLTIRTKDPVKSIQFYEDIFDMKLFVRMEVNKRNGFTLYFLGHKDLIPPSQNIDSLENREWMYQQNHLFVEIQHYWGTEHNKAFKLKTNVLGFQSLTFEGDPEILKEKLEKRQIKFQEEVNPHNSNKEIHFKSVERLKIIATNKKSV